MKKNYQKPTINVVKIEMTQMLALSGVGYVNGNAGIEYGGGSNQAARVKTNTVDWDDWDE